MTENREEEIQLGVQIRERTLNVQIWKSYVDEIEISLVNPSGVSVGPVSSILGTQRFTVGNTGNLLYYGEPNPYSVRQEIYLDFLPKQTYIDAGVADCPDTKENCIGRISDVEGAKSEYIEYRNSFFISK